VIGASDRPQSVGATVFRNLIGDKLQQPDPAGQFERDIVADMKAYRDVPGFPQVTDLTVICTPLQTLPGLIADLGAAGTKAEVMLTASLAALLEDGERSLRQVAMLDIAKPHLLRILDLVRA